MGKSRKSSIRRKHSFWSAGKDDEDYDHGGPGLRQSNGERVSDDQDVLLNRKLGDQVPHDVPQQHQRRAILRLILNR